MIFTFLLYIGVAVAFGIHIHKTSKKANFDGFEMENEIEVKEISNPKQYKSAA